MFRARGFKRLKGFTWGLKRLRFVKLAMVFRNWFGSLLQAKKVPSTTVTSAMTSA